jgi:hypothetical protein
VTGMSDEPPALAPQTLAGIDLIGRTGADGFVISYDDANVETHPIIWNAVASYQRERGQVFEVAAGFNPDQAVFRLCERLIDAGSCAHCHRPTGVTDEVDTMPLDTMICWYQFDPELATYRRGCEGEES